MDIEIFRQQLTDWGVNAQVLTVIGGISLALLVISVRVVLKWYLGIQHLEAEIAAARRQLAAMQEQLGKMELQSDFDASSFKKKEEKTGTDDAAAKDRPFRLTH